MTLFLLCKLALCLALVQQTFAEFSKQEGWQKITTVREQQIDGPPTYHRTAYEISPTYKTGELVVMDTTDAKYDVKSCMEFDYYLDVPDFASFKVIYHHSKTGIENVIWARYGYSGDVWRTASIDLKMNATDKLRFVGATSSGSIAFSEIRYDNTNGHCLNAAWTTDFEGDFHEWFANTVVISEAYPGFKDHSSDSEMGRVAYLANGVITPKFNLPVRAKCFSFWFNRPNVDFRAGQNAFQVIVNGQSVWITDDERDYPSEWIRVQIPLNFTKNDNTLQIKSFPNTQPSGSAILLDDFELSSLNCLPPVDCSFEGNTCGWTNTKLEKHAHTWSLGEGRVRSFDPFTGHNVPILRNSIYTDFTQNRPSSGIEIKSEVLPSRGEYCATLEFFYENIKKDDSFSLEHVAQAQNQYHRSVLWVMDAAAISKKPLNVFYNETVEVSVPAYQTSRRLGLFARSANEGTRIAVKSIKVREGSCKPLGTTPTPATPSKLDKNILLIADEFMKNSRENVKRILELIKIDDPIKTSAMKILAEIEATLQQIEQNLK